MSEDNKTLKQELEAILWNGDGRDPGTLSAIIKAVRDRLPDNKKTLNLDADIPDINTYVRYKERTEGFNKALEEVREILGGNDE